MNKLEKLLSRTQSHLNRKGGYIGEVLYDKASKEERGKTLPDAFEILEICVKELTPNKRDGRYNLLSYQEAEMCQNELFELAREKASNE